MMNLEQLCLFGGPAFPAIQEPWLCAPWLPRVYLFGNTKFFLTKNNYSPIYRIT